MRKMKWMLPVLALLLVLSGCTGTAGTADQGNGAETAAEQADTNNAGGAEQSGKNNAAGAEQAEGNAADRSAGDGAARIEEGLFRIGITEAPQTLDVYRSSDSYMVPLNLYERLFDIRLNDDGTTELTEGLAKEYSISKDGLTYSFTLRDDAFFSDGTPVRASDVAFSFTRMLALEDSVQKDFADAILGAEDVISGKTDTLKGIKVQDDTHLTITLSRPFAGYIYQLATPSCSIMSEKCVREAGDDFGHVPEKTIGSGPYMVTEISREQVRMELNPYYRDKSLSVKKVELRILPPALMDRTFREGGLDLLDCSNIHPDTLKNVYKSAEWKDRLLSRGCVDINYLMLNLDTHPLNDLRVRKAVQMAIDRQRILDTVYDGEGSLPDGIYPRGLIGFSEENQGWLSYDPEGAKKLLEEAGEAKNGRIELAANSQSSTRNLTVLELIREDLQAVGLEVSIVSYDDESRMYLRRAGKLMAYTGSWTADYNDPDNFIYTFFGSREKTRARSGNYADEKVISRIAAARKIQDEDKRLAEYAALEKILVQDEAVWVPLFSTNHLYVLGERTESFTPYWAGWSSMCFKDVVMK
ncbi:MAG: ABC transporter substrate-binding protein [Eubacteriales bacterium]|nr:ABC transporter substrate-binding protein [Eubacteriales bacterium]